MLGYRDRVYDDWIALEGGEAPNATLRVQLAVVHEMSSGQKSDRQLNYTLGVEPQDVGAEADQHLLGYADQQEEDFDGTGLLGDNDESPFQLALQATQDETVEDPEVTREFEDGVGNDGDWDEYAEEGQEDDEILYEEEDGDQRDETAERGYAAQESEDETANVGAGEGAPAARRREFLSVSPSASHLSAATQRSSVSAARRHTVRARRPSILLPREDQPVHSEMRLHDGLDTQFEAPTRLRLALKGARDLMARKPVLAHRIGPFPTVYCYIGWHNDEGIPSTAIERTLNPVWGEDEVFDLELQPSDFDKPVPIFIRDYDIEKEEDVGCLGVAHLDLCKIPVGSPSTWTLRIRKGRGELRVRCELEGNQAEIRQTVHRVKKLKPASSIDSMTGGIVSAPVGVATYKKKKAGPAKEEILKRLVGSDDNLSDDMRRASLVSLDEHIAGGSPSVRVGEEDEVFDLRDGSFDSSEDGARSDNKKPGRTTDGQLLRRVESSVRETPIATRHRASFVTGLAVLDMEGVAQQQKGEAPTPAGKRRPSRSVVPDTAQDALEFSRLGHEEEAERQVSHGRDALLGEILSGPTASKTSSRVLQEDANLWDDEDPDDVTRRRVLLKAPTADFGVRGARRIVGVASAAGAGQSGRRINDNNYFAAGPDANAQNDGGSVVGPAGLGQRRGSAEGDMLEDEEEVEAIGTAIDASSGEHYVSWEPGSGGFAWEAEELEDATADPFLLSSQRDQISGKLSDSAEEDEDERFFGTATATGDKREEKPAFWHDDSVSSAELAENHRVLTHQGWIDAPGETEEVTEQPMLYGKGRAAPIEARGATAASQSRGAVAKHPDLNTESAEVISGDYFEKKTTPAMEARERDDVEDGLRQYLGRGQIDTTQKIKAASASEGGKTSGASVSAAGRCRFLVVASVYKELERSLHLDTEEVADRLGKGVELLQKEYGLSEQSQDTTKVYLSQTLANYFYDFSDGSASTSNVLEGLRWLAESSRSGDTAVFYFTGRKGLLSSLELNVNSLLVTESGDEVTKKQVESCFKSWIPRDCKVYCLFDYLWTDNHGRKGSHCHALTWDATRRELTPSEVALGAWRQDGRKNAREQIGGTPKDLAPSRTSGLMHSEPAAFSFTEKEEPFNSASTSRWKTEKKQEYLGSRGSQQAGVSARGAATGATRPKKESVERSSFATTSEPHVSGTSVYQKRDHALRQTRPHILYSGNSNKMHDTGGSRRGHEGTPREDQRLVEIEEAKSRSRAYTKHKTRSDEELSEREAARAVPSQVSSRTSSSPPAVAPHEKTSSNAGHVLRRDEDNAVQMKSDKEYRQQVAPHDQRGQAFDMSRQKMLARQGLPSRRLDRKKTDASYRPDEVHGAGERRVPQVPSGSVIGIPGPYVMPHQNHGVLPHGVPVASKQPAVAAVPAPHISSGAPIVAPHHHHVVTVVHHGRPPSVPQPGPSYNNNLVVNMASNEIRPIGQPAHHHHHVVVRKTVVTSPAPNSGGPTQGRQYFHLPAPSSY